MRVQLQMIQVFTGHQSDLHSELDAFCAPNAEYVLPGSEDSRTYLCLARGRR